MSNVAIQVEDLSKRYRIGTKEVQHDTLMSAAMSWMRSPLNNFRRLRRLSAFQNGDEADVLWALRDVSFTVKHGEVIGIIGRNGAGKSTLLKILSRITPPTGGKIILNGRVASLLEVGTGFHPELTGRENVYLNGTVLGMSKMEVDRKFEEIVDFSGVEKFIDTPVKRYSSGMKVRLAFAVAAHLEPEILLVDEVLAVGDAEFQKKSLGKMGDVSKEGRTVLLVSHNMGVVSHIAKSCYWLDLGQIRENGLTEYVVTEYLKSGLKQQSNEQLSKNFVEPIKLLSAQIATNNHVLQGELTFGQVFTIQSKWLSQHSFSDLSVFVRFESSDGTIVATLNSRDEDQTLTFEPGQIHEVFWQNEANYLVPGLYYVTLALQDKSGHPIKVLSHVLEVPINHIGSPIRYARKTNSSKSGFVNLPGEWRLQKGN